MYLVILLEVTMSCNNS